METLTILAPYIIALLSLIVSIIALVDSFDR